MDYKEQYKRKLVSAEEAVKVVKSGDRVSCGFPQQPTLLTAALAARRDELEGVEMLLENPRVDDGWLKFDTPSGNIPFNVIMEYYIGPIMRRYTDAKLADYLPVTFSVEPAVLQERSAGNRGTEVYLGVVSPPDENGFCSFGANLWNKRTCALAAHKVIMEVNSSLIRTYGENYIHVSDVDYFVEHTPDIMSETDFENVITDKNPKQRAMLQEIFSYLKPYERAEHLPYLMKADESTTASYYRIFGLGEADWRLKAMSEYTKPLIRDGDTIQVGIAGVTARLAVLGTFDNRVDLGYHGEMAARGIGKLIKAGVINGKCKTIHPGKAVFTSLEGFGPEELEFANENPLIELYDAAYVVNVKTISSNVNMVSMNSIIGIDLTGQINCETTFGGRMINGPGGQPESHIGALLSPGGRAISFLYSTALDGAVSTIVPQFEAGTMVTIPRYFADYVITEYGVAKLRGKSVRERAEELIAIAHPDFHSELNEAAHQLFYP